MSDLLRRWLREEIGVTSPTDNFEQDFASGFVFGEIFHKCNLQPDFHLFVDRTHPDAMINNFTRLQPSVTKLGLPFDSKLANQIMTEEKGVASKFLYQLKTVLDSLRKDMYDSKNTGNFARTLTVATVPTTIAVESQRTKSQKAVYDAKMHKQFEENMRLHAQHPNKMYETMHLARFGDEQQAYEERMSHDEVMDYTMTMERRDSYRRERLDLMRAQRRERAEEEENLMGTHRASMTHMRTLEKKELRIELALNEKKERRRRARMDASANDALDGIDSFEKNLKRLGCDEGGQDFTGGELPPVGATPLEHLQRIKQQLPAPVHLAGEGLEYLGRLKAKKLDDVAARKERERRRRKVLLEQHRNAQEGEQKRREEALLATLSRQSKEEQRVAHRLWQLRQEKEVMRENRAHREDQYRTRREKDYEEALEREAELSASLKAQFQAQAALETQRWREAEAAHQQAKKEKRHQMVSEVSRELISLALRCAEYRESTEQLVPRKEYREWVSLFVKGIPLDPSLLVETEPAPEPDEAARALNQATLEDYLHCQGEWETKEPIGFNEKEGAIVDEMLKLTISDPEPPVLPDLSFPVKLAVLGRPFSGKTSTAKALAEAHDLALFDPELVVAAAVEAAAAADAPQPPPEEGSAPAEAEAEARPRSPAQEAQLMLGRRAQEALAAGQEVPDDVVVSLIIAAITKLSEDASADPSAPGEEKPAAKGGKDAKGAKDAKAGKDKPKTPPAAKGAKGAKGGKDAAKGAEPGREPGLPAELTGPRGFVLDGFPRTEAQAALLEKALTGLDLEYRAAIKARASVICPPPKDPTDDLPLVSGLDKVVMLEVTGEEVELKRALGRRVDPEDGHIYHMEFDPPPANNAGLLERLEENLGPYNDAALAQVRLETAAQEAPPLEAWLQRFDNLLAPVPAEGPPADVFALAKEVADEVLAAKQKALETKLAAAAAATAAEQCAAARDASFAAKAAAEGAAAALLGWKKAEVEAAEQLKGDEDAVAKQLLAKKTSEEVAVCLMKAKEAMQEAEEAAQSAAEQDAAAQAALALAREKATATDAAVEAKASAEFAAEQAKVSREAAAAACAAAKAASEEAVGIMNAAEKTSTMSQEELFPPPPEETPEAPAPVEPPAELPLEVPPFVPLTHDLATILYGQWALVEECYLKGLKSSFFNLREERRTALGHFAEVKQNFLEYLRRPDAKQQMLTTFQVEYNAVDLDMRRLPEAKGEMLLRAEELRDALWDVCDTKRDENQAELERIMGDSWVTDRSVLLVKHFTALVQLEADGFAATHGLANDYFRAKCNYQIHPRNMDPSAFGGAKLEDLGDWGKPMKFEERPGTPPEGGDAAADAKGKGGKVGKADKADKAKKPTTPPATKEGAGDLPPWLLPVQEAAPNLGKALKKALALIPLPTETEESAPADAKAPAKGAKEVEVSEEERELDRGAKVAALALKESGVLASDSLRFEQRLQRLASRAVVYLSELAEAADTTKGRLEEWMTTRYQAECSAVAAVVTVIREAAHAEVELNHDLTFEGEDLLEDISTLTAEPFVPPPPPPAPEEEPAVGVLTCHQLQLVAQHFQAVAPHGLMTVEECAALLARVGMEDGGRAPPPPARVPQGARPARQRLRGVARAAHHAGGRRLPPRAHCQAAAAGRGAQGTGGGGRRRRRTAVAGRVPRGQGLVPAQLPLRVQPVRGAQAVAVHGPGGAQRGDRRPAFGLHDATAAPLHGGDAGGRHEQGLPCGGARGRAPTRGCGDLGAAREGGVPVRPRYAPLRGPCGRPHRDTVIQVYWSRCRGAGGAHTEGERGGGEGEAPGIHVSYAAGSWCVSGGRRGSGTGMPRRAEGHRDSAPQP